jgi:CubicO group peptidase (beta-lactamase class C family)
MMKTHALGILAVLGTILGAAFGNCYGQGPSANTLPAYSEQAKKVEAYIAPWDKPDQPGCAIGAIKDGQLVYKRAFGLANLDYDIPNTTTTLFTMASVSKQFTAMSVLLLAQQGKLSLDDDIRKYLPEMPDYGDKITIRHLLNHTSGIREYQAVAFFSGLGADNAYSEQAILKMLAAQRRTNFKPGEKHEYSNSGYQLAGTIVSRVSGKSLRAFADENIFKPLGMKNTQYFDNRNEVIKNRATGYQVGPQGIKMRASLFDLVGGGGVMTTVEDLLLWDQNFYEPKVGTKELIAQMTTPATLNSGEKIDYAFGLVRGNYRGLPTVQHGGNMTGFRAQIFRLPEQKFTAVTMCNNSARNQFEINQKLADIFLEGQFPATPAPKKATDMPAAATTPISETDAARYAGIYANADDGSYFRIDLKDGKLAANGILGNNLSVTPLANGDLQAVKGQNRTWLVPVVDKSGAVSAIKIPLYGGRFDVFTAVKPMDPSPEKLKEYAGTYHSDELNVDYEMSPQGSGRVFSIGETMRPTFNPAYADAFSVDAGIVLTFTRDEKGKVNGFVLNSGLDNRSVKGVMFKRK